MATYKELGVKKIINAAGTYTKFGGSLMSEDVLNAMKEASKHFVNIEDLLVKTGEHLSNLLGVESALVTAGAANAMAISAAACIAGSEPANIRKLPDVENMKNEIVIMRSHRNPYDQAMRGVGAKFIEIGNAIETFPWELEDAIGNNTAAVAYFVQSDMLRSSLPLSEVLKVAHAKNIPVIVDAAAELPPINNLTKFIEMGSDIVLFSGGKDLRGPQSSGLMLGKKELIDTCRLHAYPNHSIGRSMKLDKETIMGLVRAIELYIDEDHSERMKEWEKQVNRLYKELESIPNIKVRCGLPSQPLTQPANIPRIFIEFDEDKLNMSKELVEKKLIEGDPPIAVVIDKHTININPHMLKEEEEKIVIEKFKKIFQKN